MTVYDVLENRHVMPRAWDDWVDYRRTWTELILRYSKRDTTLLIIGAGSCNDYDMERLSRFFREIYLLDLDKNAMKESLLRVPAAYKGRFDFYTADFLGIKPTEYTSFCNELQKEINHYGRNTDIKDLANIALPLIESMYANAKRRRESLQLPKADYVAVSGVHSQINHMLPWIWDAHMQTLGQREEMIFRRASMENEPIIRDMNTKLLEAAGRRLYVSAEKTRMGVPGLVEGARQALDDMKKRVDDRNLFLTDSQTVPWAYDLRQNMIYEMEMLVMTTDPVWK